MLSMPAGVASLFFDLKSMSSMPEQQRPASVALIGSGVLAGSLQSIAQGRKPQRTRTLIANVMPANTPRLDKRLTFAEPGVTRRNSSCSVTR